jgi:hypothetical protein
MASFLRQNILTCIKLGGILPHMSDNPLDMVRGRREEISRTILELQAEDKDLEITERTLLRLNAIIKPIPTTIGGDNQQGTISKKALVIKALRDSPNIWFDNPDSLHAYINNTYKVEIPSGSYPTYLSRLKTEGLISRIGLKIALTERVETIEAPKGASISGSDDAEPIE